jgi:transcription antitermination protein NusB
MEMNESTLIEVLEGKRQVGEDEPGEFAIELVKGVRMNLPAIDAVISGYSQGWVIDRMPRVDRNILRMALFEIFFEEDIPAGASIDEAVELAKEFSTEDSGKFINGLLGRANRDREEGKLSLPAG